MSARQLEAEIAFRAQAALGEGPVWDEAVQRLRWVDITGRQLHELDPESGVDRALGTSRPVGAVALATGGTMLLALDDRLAVVDGDAPLRELEGLRVDAGVVRFNDGKADPWGTFHVGTMHHEGTKPLGALYRVGIDLVATEVFHAVTCSNGLDWNAARSELFHVDSVLGRVDVHATDSVDGSVLGRLDRIPIDPPGIPDGLTLDSDGCIWVAMWGGGEIRRITRKGVVDRVVRLPVSNVTSMAFGGRDYDQLFITTARDSLSAEQSAHEPHAGDVFWCRPGTTGLPPHRFGGRL